MIVVQKNRLLISSIFEHKVSEFIKMNTIFEKNMSFGYNEKWIAIAEVEFDSKVFIALPRSYPLKTLLPFVEEDEILRSNYNIEYEKIKINLKKEFDCRNPLQFELSDFLLGANKYSELFKKPRRALFADTGIGKTFLTIKNICTTKIKPVIFCPDDRAIKVWTEEFLKFTDIQESEICIIKGTITLKRTLKKKDQYKIILFSTDTAGSMFDSNKIDEFISFFEEMKIGLKIFDEMHLRLKSIFFIDMYLCTFRTFYLTATNVMRIYGEQKVMVNMTPSEDCVYQQEYVRKFELIKVVYYTEPENQAVYKLVNKPNGFDALEYLKYATEDEVASKFFLEDVIEPTYKLSLRMLKNETKYKVAIITKTNSSGRIIGEYLAKKFPNKTIGYFNSSIQDMKVRELELNCEIIISTDKSFSGILNIYNLSVIINCTPITSEAHIKQIMGRLREEGDKRRLVFQLCDSSFKKAANMLYRQIKTCEPVTTSIKLFKINDQNTVVVTEE